MVSAEYIVPGKADDSAPVPMKGIQVENIRVLEDTQE